VRLANGGARGDVRAVLEGDARAGVSAGAGREVEVERERVPCVRAFFPLEVC
jgi:hypothetical protein